MDLQGEILEESKNAESHTVFTNPGLLLFLLWPDFQHGEVLIKFWFGKVHERLVLV